MNDCTYFTFSVSAEETITDLTKVHTNLSNYLYTPYYENSKYFDGKYDKDSIFDFVQSKKEYREKYKESFGETMRRDELVEYIEENGLEEELRQRVVDKWEAFEDSIKSNRKKKYYSKQPESEE